MTFTNKAANEMKERILQKLIQLSKEPSERTSEDTKELQKFAADFGMSEQQITERSSNCLNSILHNYSMFSVMTIDKFTHKVIRTFARELGLSMDFEVELDLEMLRRNVADILFDKIGRDDEVTKLMVHYADSNLEEDKSWNFKRTLIDFSKQLFREDALNAIQELTSLDGDAFIKAQKEIIKERKIIENKLIQLGTEARDLIYSKNLAYEDFPHKSTSVLAHFERISEGRKDLRASARIVKAVEGNEWCHKDSPNQGVIDEISPLLDKYFWQIEDMFDNVMPDYNLKGELLKNINNLSLLTHLLEITNELKEEENVLLISDFYKKIAEVISNEPVPFIYERLGTRYEHFLLDEFQDTSHLQWVNLVPLLHNSLATKSDNLIVGDGKQAIYRWRNGEVEQFIQLPDNVYNPGEIESLKEAQGKFKDEGETILIKDNWRSAKEIVHFNNAYFKWLSDASEGYIQRVYKEGDQNVKREHPGFVEFFTPEDKSQEVQLNYVLSSIKRCLDKGYEPQDICVLVRINRQGADVARYLNAAGLDVVSKDSLFVSRDLTVKFIYNLLKSLTNPRNKNFKKKSVEHFDQLFNTGPHLFELLDDEWIIKDWLKKQGYEFRPYPSFHSFYEYVEHLIATFDLDIAKNVYLQFFLEQVHVFEKRQNNNIHSFIEWFEEQGYKQSVITPEGSNAVNVMSIHKAKGLQFPIVICAFFDWDPSKNKSEQWIINKSEVIPAFPLKSTKASQNTIYGEQMVQEDMKQKLDHLNMIYVAFTRPETALFVSSCSGKRSSIHKTWIGPYLKLAINEGSMANVEDTYSIGMLPNYDGDRDSITNELKADFPEQHMDKPRLSTKNADQWDIHDLEKRRHYGTQLHLLLSQINGPEDAIEVTESLLRKQKIAEENKDTLLKDIERLFDNAVFASYFEGDQILNEQEIITKQGEKLIPDKIIMKNDEVLVVDFKTGEGKTESHIKQLNKYMELLEEITEKKVKGQLFYTEDLEVKNL